MLRCGDAQTPLFFLQYKYLHFSTDDQQLNKAIIHYSITLIFLNPEYVILKYRVNATSFIAVQKLIYLKKNVSWYQWGGIRTYFSGSK